MTTVKSYDLGKLKRLLPRFRKVRVAVLGDMMLDRYVSGSASRLSPEAAVPVVEFESQSNCAGGAGNVAANLAALGARVWTYGALGGKKISSKKTVDDEAGADFRKCLLAAGIADSGVIAVADRITTVKTRVVARHQQIVRIDHERHDALSADTEEKLFRLLLSQLKSINAVVLSDYDKGVLSEAFTQRLLHACNRNQVPAFVKPNTSRRSPYHGARLVVCNRKEARHYLNATSALMTDPSVEEAARNLLSHFGCSAIVITRTEQGMSILEENSPHAHHIPAIGFEAVNYARVGQPGIERGFAGRQVFDVTGAGDTVLSVLSLAVAAGASLPEAAFLANAAAGVVVGKLGTATVTVSELGAALDDVYS
ncbi:MAG TPA: PfkB family carbohydrate kinase [Dongiaceae bacterium]|nr:PfkB family carbohydrate kinase [Dongiaceae bacterium]